MKARREEKHQSEPPEVASSQPALAARSTDSAATVLLLALGSLLLSCSFLSASPSRCLHVNKTCACLKFKAVLHERHLNVDCASQFPCAVLLMLVTLAPHLPAGTVCTPNSRKPLSRHCRCSSCRARSGCSFDLPALESRSAEPNRKKESKPKIPTSAAASDKCWCS